MRASGWALVALGLAALACGGPGDALSDAPPMLSDEVSHIDFTLTGDRLAAPVRFAGTSTSLKATLATDEPAVLFRGEPIMGDIPGFELTQLVLSLPNKQATTHASDQFKVTFTITGPLAEDGGRTTFSILAAKQGGGQISVTEATDRLRASFDLTGSPTQISSKGLVYQIQGSFDLARCLTLFCK